MNALRHRRRGQTSVEYMMVISVLVIAIVFALGYFIDPFNESMEDLSERAETAYTKNRMVSF